MPTWLRFVLTVALSGGAYIAVSSILDGFHGVETLVGGAILGGVLAMLDAWAQRRKNRR